MPGRNSLSSRELAEGGVEDGLDILFGALQNTQEQRQAAELTLRHVIGSVLAKDSAVTLANEDQAQLWTSLIEHVSRSLRPETAYAIRPLLVTLYDLTEKLGDEDAARVGRTSRRLLEWAWEQDSRDGTLVLQALRSALRVFGTNPESTAGLLRRALQADHIAQFGFEELPWIAREMKHIVEADPELAADLYRAAFDYEETSKDETQVSGSRLLRLTSFRAQDYRMAHYELACQYKSFLSKAPLDATRAAISVMESFVKQRHDEVLASQPSRTFRIRGHKATFQPDYSIIWETGDTFRHDHALKILDTFIDYLDELATERQFESLDLVLGTLFEEARLAVFFRRLLILGCQHPKILGQRLAPLASSQVVLVELDTSTAAGDFLGAVSPELNSEQRRSIEQTILSLPEDPDTPDDVEPLMRIRNRLLGCLPKDTLVTEDARQAVAELEKAGSVPENTPPFEFAGPTSSAFGEVEHLRSEGVEVDKAANQRVQLLEKPVKAFADNHQNTTPGPDELIEVMPAINALWQALRSADADGVHEKQQNYAWGTLAEACERAARTDSLDCQNATGNSVRSILLAASSYPAPTPSGEDFSFDEAPSWGKPAARIDAAAGLMALARNSACFSREVLEAVTRLVEDDVPSVRFQVAARLNSMSKTATRQMWHLIESFASSERSSGVLQGLLSGPLNRLASSEPHRIAEVSLGILDRTDRGPGWARLREQCIHLNTQLYVWRAIDSCGKLLRSYMKRPQSYPKEALAIVAMLREPIVYSGSDIADSSAADIRSRSIQLLDSLVSQASAAADALRKSESTAFDQWPTESQETLGSLYELISRVADQVYFASGAYEARSDELPSAEHQHRVYQELSCVLDRIAEVGLPAAAHHLLETLQFWMEVDPKGVLLRVERVILAAKDWGYQFESLAVGLVVRIVERYLADHRDLFQREESCRQGLLRILDVFVDVGWPEARLLTYRLDELFR